MKKVLSFVIFTGLFLAVGLMAFLAMPSDGATVADAPQADVVAGQEVNAPEAPTATNNRNHVALPLDASGSISPYNAQGLLSYIGSSALIVESWNAVNGNLDFWDGTSGFGIISGTFTFDPNDFPLQTGYPYLVTVDSTANNTFTIVGDVPPPGAIDFTFIGTSPCSRNELTLPLDQTGSGINNAANLATDIGNVDTVEQWNSVNQNLDFWDVTSGFGIISGTFTFDPNDFPVQAGYPYFACVNASGNGTVWP